MRKRIMNLVNWKYRLPFTWLAVLAFLYAMDTAGPSLCLFTLAGFPECPGCGLGHAIHLVMHGNVTASLEAHVLGIPALAAISFQVYKTWPIKTKTTPYG